MAVLTGPEKYTRLVLDVDNGGLYHLGMPLTQLAKDFKKHGLTPTSAAKKIGIAQSEIYRWVKGIRPITMRGALALAPLVKRSAQSLMFSGRTVRIVGKVGGATEAHFHAETDDGFIGLAKFPDEGSDDTVAVEVEGDSAGALNGWIAYYDDRREPPTHDLIGKLCVVGLTSGQILVKMLMPGRIMGHYDLFAIASGSPLHDQAVAWAALVISMAPRERAVIEESQEEEQRIEQPRKRKKKRGATKGVRR